MGDRKQQGELAFSRLRPLCTKLLDFSSSTPEERAIVIDGLGRVLKDLDPAGLEKCMDYVLFPLLLLLDGAVSGRMSRVTGTRTSLPSTGFVPDKVAEGVLECLEVVFSTCSLETKEQMMTMLQKLTRASMLSASEASEEFRHGVVKCLKALFANLKSCSSCLCSCKLVRFSPFESLKREEWSTAGAFEPNDSLINASDGASVCPMGLLQLETMGPAVGHLISLLVQIAEAEVVRGCVGSGRLRRDALSALRLLITQVGSADALAYFLPGAVRGYASAMRFTQSQINAGFSTPNVHISGAGGWPAVVEEAVRGLAEILAICLGDNMFEDAKSSDSVVRTDKWNGISAVGHIQDLATQLRNDEMDSSTCERGDGKSATSAAEEYEINDTTQLAEKLNDLSFRVERNKLWISSTGARVHLVLQQTFPLLCAHPSPAVRLAVVEAVTVLLMDCRRSLDLSNSLLLECLLALACDDIKHIASAAQVYLCKLTGFQSSLWSNINPSRKVRGLEKLNVELEEAVTGKLSSLMPTLLQSLLQDLPKKIFSANTASAVSQARRLTAAMYFCGPKVVASCLLSTPVDSQRFSVKLRQCLSISTAFLGSLREIASDPSASYRGVFEILPADVESRDILTRGKKKNVKDVSAHKDPAGAGGIPSIPPWLAVDKASQLYGALAEVLRLAGLAATLDRSNGLTLFCLVDSLLTDIRAAADSQRRFDAVANLEHLENEQRQRTAAASACVLNEIIFGASGNASRRLFSKFQAVQSVEYIRESPFPIAVSEEAKSGAPAQSDAISAAQLKSRAEFGNHEVSNGIEVDLEIDFREDSGDDLARKVLTEIAGEIVHDYMSAHLWEDPKDKSEGSLPSPVVSSFGKHQDLFMLQKVLIEGVGVLAGALGKAFEDSGLLRLVLFPLLEKLASCDVRVSQAAAGSLSAICFNCQYPAVKDLVAANLDYVVDMLCRQFRHLDLYPQSLNLLAAILRHTNAAPDLLPLLSEPLQYVVMELDVVTRSSRSHLIDSLLKAMREIICAAGLEVDGMLAKVKAAATLWSRSTLKESVAESADETRRGTFTDAYVEDQVDKFLDGIRPRQAVLKVAGLGLTACGPFLTSKDPQICLLTLDIIADGTKVLADAEGARQSEVACREALKGLCSEMHDPVLLMRCRDAISADETEPNHLLPTMNRIWPYLVTCLRQGRTPVIVRAVEIMAFVMVICGGDFFTRRFKSDALPVVVGILRQALSVESVHSRRSFSLVPQTYLQVPEQGPAALLRTQLATLNAITSIAANRKSASALKTSIDVVASWVVVLACQVEPLKVAATEAAVALSLIDADFVWLLVADMLSGAAKDVSMAPTLPGFPDLNRILPTWSSKTDALWCQYANYQGKFGEVDQNCAQLLLAKLEEAPQLMEG